MKGDGHLFGSDSLSARFEPWVQGRLSNLVQRPDSREAHGELEVGHHVLEQFFDPRGTCHGKRISVGPPDAHCIGSHGQSFEDVGTRPDAGIEQDGHSTVHRFDNLPQSLEGADRTVHLAAAVIGDINAVGTVVDGLAGILGMKNTLEYNRQAGVLFEKGDVLPGQVAAGVDLDELSDGRQRSAGL
jgi:hypothetical protein